MTDFEELKDPELQAKLKHCETPEELLELVRESGMELSEQDLEGIAGGISWGKNNCKTKHCRSVHW